MTDRIVTLCRHCRKETEVFGCSFCSEHYQPWIIENYRRYDDLRAEGHSIYAARLMAGLSDPEE